MTRARLSEGETGVLTGILRNAAPTGGGVLLCRLPDENPAHPYLHEFVKYVAGILKQKGYLAGGNGEYVPTTKAYRILGVYDKCFSERDPCDGNSESRNPRAMFYYESMADPSRTATAERLLGKLQRLRESTRGMI